MFSRCEVIKYQLLSEDLDTLVTIASDEDVAHMLDEYDRLDALHPCSPSFASSSRFRLFLFPSSSSSSSSASHSQSHPAAAATHDQRYVDAINSPVPGSPRRPPIFTISAASSAVTSPTSTIDGTAALLALRANAPIGGGGGGGGGGGMHRVQSTPNLGGGGMHRVQSTPNLGGGGGLSLSQMGNSGAGPPHHHLHHPYHHSPQHRHLHRQQSAAATVYVAQAAGGGGAWRAGGGAPRYEACGPRPWPPQPAARGGIYYGGGGSVCLGHAEESSSGRTSRSSSPFRALPREPVIWE